MEAPTIEQKDTLHPVPGTRTIYYRAEDDTVWRFHRQQKFVPVEVHTDEMGNFPWIRIALSLDMIRKMALDGIR